MGNLRAGDGVISTVDLGSVRKGTKGTIVEVSTWHGLCTVAFEGAGAKSGIKLTQVSKI